MVQRTISFRGRRLLLSSLGCPLDDSLRAPFAALVPAFDEREREHAEALTGSLVDLGCVEICCVGPESEALHDSIDWLLEDRGAVMVVTTWHTDCQDACEHFLFAAGGMPSTLLALVLSHPDLAASLVRHVRRE